MSMRKALIFIIFFTEIGSEAVAEPQYYAKAFAARASMDTYSSGVAAGLGFGKKLYQFIPHFVVEGEVSKSFSSLKLKQATNPTKRSFTDAAVFGAFTFPVNYRYAVKGKLGFHYVSISDKVTDNTNNTSTRNNSHDAGLEAGVGLVVTLDPRKDIVMEYTTNDTNDFSQLMLAFQFNY